MSPRRAGLVTVTGAACGAAYDGERVSIAVTDTASASAVTVSRQTAHPARSTDHMPQDFTMYDTPGTVTHVDTTHTRGNTRALAHWYSVTDYAVDGASNLAFGIATKRAALARARRSVTGKEYGTVLAIVRRHTRDTGEILTIARVSTRRGRVHVER